MAVIWKKTALYVGLISILFVTVALLVRWRLAQPGFVDGGQASAASTASMEEPVAESGGEPAEPKSTQQGFRVYKWQDEEGVWHFAAEKPDVAHEEILVQDPTIIQMPAPSLSPGLPESEPHAAKPGRVIVIGDKNKDVKRDDDLPSQEALVKQLSEFERMMNDFKRSRQD